MRYASHDMGAAQRGKPPQLTERPLCCLKIEERFVIFAKGSQPQRKTDGNIFGYSDERNMSDCFSFGDQQNFTRKKIYTNCLQVPYGMPGMGDA